MEFLHIIAMTPIILAIAAFVTPLLTFLVKRRAFYASYLTTLALFTAIASSYTLYTVYTTRKPIVYPFGGWPPPLGIVYEIDFISAILGALASILFLFTAIYSYWYFGKIEKGYEWMTTLLLLLMAGILGCIYTGDIFNFFVMLEVLCISSYALVAFFRKRKWAIEASASYAFIGALATTLFLFGAIYIYASFGTLNIADITAKSHGWSASALSTWSGVCRGYQCIGNIAVASAVAVALMLWALTFEAGIFPNNFWIPSAYTEAPTPASALFAGIVDKVGTYGVIRLFFTMFTAYGSTLTFCLGSIPFRDAVLMILSILGLVTGYLGALLMAIQNDVKRLLAYSTISHIGIIFTIFAVGMSSYSEELQVLAMTAMIFHMITHALGESMAFLGLGTLATIARSRKLDDMVGYGRLYPGMGIAIALGLLSLLGILPLAGFFSKYLLFLAFLEAKLFVHAVSIILISGISAIGYFKVLYTLFALKPCREVEKEKAIPATATCLAMATMLIVLGIAFITGLVFEPLKIGIEMSISRSGVLSYVMSADRVASILGVTR